MARTDSCTGCELREMFATATAWLEKSAQDIDALNVFPVPDGDTGTNMLLTMHSTMEEAYHTPDESASAVAQAMARGALMGARGNSGVILSQILRGLARGLEGKPAFDGHDLASALVEASALAYKGISQPVEGTMLTVIRECSDAAKQAASADSCDVESILEATVNAAGESVARTPSLLPVLKQAGVVDAGGQGLFVILKGALRFLQGEDEAAVYQKPQIIPSTMPVVLGEAEAKEGPFGYDTEFLVEGEKLNPDKIRKKLEKKGESLIVVGDRNTVKVHIHTHNPGEVISYATREGTLHDIHILNMDDQHQAFKEMQRTLSPTISVATIAVVSGDGLAQVFQSLGVTAIVPGGQTMNPSTQELLRAIDGVPAEKAILLPNNPNIVPVAEQARSLAGKEVAVVPTLSIPQGVAALLALNYEADLKTNVVAMEKARRAVTTIEMTRAVKSRQLGRLKIKKKQAIGLIDGELVAAGDDMPHILGEMLPQMHLEGAEVVTLYYGANTNSTEAEEVAGLIRQQAPQAQVEVVNGGQPHHHYIISVE
jgi:hypothetical protein